MGGSEKDRKRLSSAIFRTPPLLSFALSPVSTKASAAKKRRTPLYVFPPHTTCQGMRPQNARHAPEPWTTRPLWFSSSVVVARPSSPLHPLPPC